MRNLTEEELKLAPDWATHYAVDSDESIIYESEKLCWWVGRRDPLNNEGSFGNISNRAIKPFDITKHEFSDSDVCIDYLNISKDKLMVETSIHTPAILNKYDVIAMAKALGVTREDLK